MSVVATLKYRRDINSPFKSVELKCACARPSEPPSKLLLSAGFEATKDDIIAASMKTL